MMAFAALVPWRYVAMVAAALIIFWFVRDLGVQAERGRWEAKTAVEVSRQQDILEDAQRASEVSAGLLLQSEATRQALVRRLRNEATRDPGADAMCIGPAGILRLNAIGGAAKPN